MICVARHACRMPCASVDEDRHLLSMQDAIMIASRETVIRFFDRQAFNFSKHFSNRCLLTRKVRGEHFVRRLDRRQLNFDARTVSQIDRSQRAEYA